ncbi:MAG: tyrosine-type recombinase/integrase [Gammaproteobacteria bacterium]|nr:tyrosine-type recombinase/integrase [Gammaproteobacteria bacterium]
MRSNSQKCRNPNHPKKGSRIKVEPIRDKESIQKLKDLLADNPRDLCLFTLGINTAYRANELVSIKVGQVAHLSVGDRLDLKQSKNGKYRSVTLNNNAVNAIQACLADHPNPLPFAPLFLSKTTNEALKSNTVSKYMKKWCNQLGILGNYSSHTMRKTWGYHVYRHHNIVNFSPVDTKIAELMTAYGHASERQTLEYLCIQDRDISALYMRTEL